MCPLPRHDFGTKLRPDVCPGRQICGAVKLIETITGPAGLGRVVLWDAMMTNGKGMKQSAVAAVVMAASLASGAALAQSPLAVFDNLFTGSISQPSRPAAPQRAAVTLGVAAGRRAALERRGRRVRPSFDDRERDPRVGRQF
ncbi:MAG: hypothetical protein MZV49_16385 [Rhodopseudomonas palustris]|nr:hypothetical protein [Rhodopseudomonas palustris]